MSEARKEISVTVINAGEVTVVKTHLHEFRNLMVLLNNSVYLENFGECGGQGRCATCIVKVAGLFGDANLVERNESATLGKSGLHNEGVRLSCQLLINQDLNGAVVEIPGEGY